MQRALVTGAAGFIGSHLCATLLERGYRVRGVDNFETGKRRNLDPLLDRDGFRFSEVDIRDGEELSGFLDDVTAVFHQAAMTSVQGSIDNPRKTTDTNCTGTATVLDEAHRNGVDTVVVASSSAIYGSEGTLPKTEAMETHPESPYALSKEYTENLTLQFDERYDIDTVGLRYFNVFGPRQDPSGEYAAVIPKFIELMLDGERPVIYGDGEQSRDFVFVDDVVEANILAVESHQSGLALNVASGNRITINELVDRLNDVLGTDIDPIHEAPRPGDVRHSEADIDRARESIGYEPTVGLSEGLERTVEWFRDEGK